MITIDQLKALGADTEDGLKRCLGNETFYLRLVGMAIANDGYEKLRDAIDAGNLDEAFERAHALKGMLGNVSLTNLLDPVTEMVEELRLRHDIDYSPMLERLFTELDRLRSL